MRDYSFIIHNMVWSYSRLDSYNTCPYAWYLNYILGKRHDDSFYGEYGTLMHEMIARLYENKEERESLLMEYFSKFNDDVTTVAKTLKDYKATKQKYFSAGADYIENFAPLPFKEILSIEEQWFFKLEDYSFTGFIDLIVRDHDDNIVIIDHKSADIKKRSKRKDPTLKDAELDKHLRQLYLYSIPVFDKWGKYPSKLVFNCFKTGELIEEPFVPEVFEEVKQWALRTIKQIEKETEWEAIGNYMTCRDLCSVRSICEFIE